MVVHWCLYNKINRTLHGRLEIRNFFSSVEKYFTSDHSERVKYFSTLEEKFCISTRPCTILYIYFYFLFIHKMHIHLYIYSLDILLTYIFTAHQDFKARSYPRIFCRALSDNSTDKDHLSKVVIYGRLSLSKRITLNCPNIYC